MLTAIPSVSRETQALLAAEGAFQDYLDLLLKWQARINLIARSTQSDALVRHVSDSLQLLGLFAAEPVEEVLDLGSGGGMPAVPLAIAFKALGWPHRLTLIESDKRKAAFLREVSRKLALDLTVLSQRLESLEAPKASTITARAFAPLARLLAWSQGVSQPQTRFVLLKGAQWREEIEQALLDYRFSYRAYQSSTHEAAAIIEIKDVSPAV